MEVFFVKIMTSSPVVVRLLSKVKDYLTFPYEEQMTSDETNSQKRHTGKLPEAHSSWKR